VVWGRGLIAGLGARLCTARPVRSNVLISALRSSRGASHRLLTLVGGEEPEIALSAARVLVLWRPILRDPRDDHVRELAEAEGVSINQLITTARRASPSATPRRAA